MTLRRCCAYLVIFSLALSFSGCATAPGNKMPAPSGKLSLTDLCEENKVVWQWDSVSQVLTLRYHDSKASVLVGSNVVLFDKDKIILSDTIKIKRSLILVPADFKEKVIDRLKRVERKVTYAVKKRAQVILDPGHGGKDPGALGRTGLKEKTVVLDIARRVKRILEGNGVKVILTRDSDVFISLKERTEMASRSRAELFLSIHANSHPSRNTYGTEVYYLKDLSETDKREDQRLDNSRLMFNHLAMRKGSTDLNEIVSDMLYAYKQSESVELASAVSSKTSQLARTKNLGRKQARFFVLRNTLIPAILAEVGFLTNFKEERNLKMGVYRQKIAEALAKTVLDYLHGK